jgi:hypothetical protein
MVLQNTESEVKIMNYDLKMNELIKIIQKKLDELKGKDVQKEGGISHLVESAMNDMEEISLSKYHIEVKECRFKMYCAGMDNDIEFAVIGTEYKADKRRWNGVGHVLESVTINLTREIPLDLEVLNVSQFLDYNVAKENFERLERQQRELLEEYKSNYEAMERLQKVMKSEAYDKETTKESENAEEILEEFGSFKI